MTNLIGKLALAGALLTGCGETEVLDKKDSRLPEVRGNQTLILHPDYLSGFSSLGYTLLTDMDHSGDWDVAERYHVGFTPGDSSHKYYYKKGFGPARFSDIEIEFVEPNFFEPYR